MWIAEIISKLKIYLKKQNFLSVLVNVNETWICINIRALFTP